MVRPRCPRRVGRLPSATYFKPRGIPVSELEEVILEVDELEALRLADLEGLYQEEAAARMAISRATFGRIVESARRKVADSLVSGKALRVEGGAYEVRGRRAGRCCGCGRPAPREAGRSSECPRCGGESARRAAVGRKKEGQA